MPRDCPELLGQYQSSGIVPGFWVSDFEKKTHGVGTLGL